MLNRLEQRTDELVGISPALILCTTVLFLATNTWLLGTYIDFVAVQSAISLKLTAAAISIWLILASLFASLHITSFTFSWIDLLRGCPPKRNYDSAPLVAVLYLCKDDLSELALRSCVRQDYANFRVYVLDDSSLPGERARVDVISDEYRDRISVIRRIERGSGYKAGNLNNALQSLPLETSYICVIDADEVIPVDFVRETVAICEANSRLAFVQASHTQYGLSHFGKQMGDSIDLHWKYYLTARNSRGFVYSFGHGVTFRMSALRGIGGFPEVVAEDIAVSVVLRQAGFTGYFAPDVCCLEEAPASYAAFRRRSRKITLGTLQFLSRFYPQFWRSLAVTRTEKLDLLLASVIPIMPVVFLGLLACLGALSIMGIAVHAFDVDHLLTLRSPAQAQRAKLTILAFITIFAPLIYLVPGGLQAPVRTLAFVCRAATIHLSLCVDSFRAAIQWFKTKRAAFHTTGDRTHGRGIGAHERADRILGLTALLVALFSGSAFLAAVGLALAMVPRMIQQNLDGKIISMIAFCPILLTLAGLLGLPGTALAATGVLASIALAHH